MLAAENEALPSFMRFGGNTAFVEGWALYAETLWDELGMETDPYQRFGGLNDEMLRAMRLVVDSGIHAKGWTRDQAIQYMLDNSGMSRTEVVAEVERYIAIPGQAQARLSPRRRPRLPRPGPRRRRRPPGCTGCSATATRRACAAIRSARSSVAIIAMPTSSAISAPTPISMPSGARRKRIWRRCA